MNEVKRPKKPLIFYYLVVLGIMLLINLIAVPWFAEKQVRQVDYGTFMSMTEAGDIGRVDVQSNQILFTNKEDTKIFKTGVMYDPESLRDHMYYPCPKHPDTGTEIAGIKIPHWDLICRKVVEICRMMPELEYLGFDIAVTEDAFNVMEINIHQDLHKVAQHSDEIRAFYADKIRYKEMLYSRREIDE